MAIKHKRLNPERVEIFDDGTQDKYEISWVPKHGADGGHWEAKRTGKSHYHGTQTSEFATAEEAVDAVKELLTDGKGAELTAALKKLG